MEQNTEQVESESMKAEVRRQLEVIQRGTAEIVPEADLEKKLTKSLENGEPLRIKLGLDPTAPDIHLGHTVVLQKIRQMQELGHVAHIVIGDFTGRIGDPTDKAETRRQLTADEVKTNADTYVKQIYKVLLPEQTQVVFNSEWLEPLNFEDVIKLASTLTVARMLEREDFTKRFRENRAIHIHEFFYPLMQAYDSVALKSDIELGGTDQKFNLLMGRTLQREYGQEEQVTIMMPLLEGLDGVHKMSKSLGNYIGVDEEPHSMFGKVMSMPDELMLKYFELVSDVSLSDLEEIKNGLGTGKLHPRDLKMRLAQEFVSRFHDAAAAKEAVERWQTVFQQGAAPEDMPEVSVGEGALWIVGVLVDAKLVTSRSEARRMVTQGAVKLDGEKVTDANAEIEFPEGAVLQVGKRKFVRIKR